MNSKINGCNILYYIDIIDGEVKRAKFIEEESQGVWIKIDSEVVNTFVYEDKVDSRIFCDEAEAKKAMEEYRKQFIANLKKDNKFIEDILTRLKKTEGKLYLGIIDEILHDVVT